ncbi:hypothetical protein NLI96_g4595 [Meripilus lineatus]|uniref:Uncharacterized protein n=1 Tax=Meripilus lineatus TaxID=2056292 RepID=A0AAD5V4W3_9APHY|nr:hypothetical protein NLI96_g4595 [Physisporinus lineatus]
MPSNHKANFADKDDGTELVDKEIEGTMRHSIGDQRGQRAAPVLETSASGERRYGSPIIGTTNDRGPDALHLAMNEHRRDKRPLAGVVKL